MGAKDRAWGKLTLERKNIYNLTRHSRYINSLVYNAQNKFWYSNALGEKNDNPVKEKKKYDPFWIGCELIGGGVGSFVGGFLGTFSCGGEGTLQGWICILSVAGGLSIGSAAGTHIIGLLGNQDGSDGGALLGGALGTLAAGLLVASRVTHGEAGYLSETELAAILTFPAICAVIGYNFKK